MLSVAIRGYGPHSIPADNDLTLYAGGQDVVEWLRDPVLRLTLPALPTSAHGERGGGEEKRDGDLVLEAVGQPELNAHAHFTRVHLVGHDWGSAIVQIASKLQPTAFASLTLLAVPPIQGAPLRVLFGAPHQLLYSWCARNAHIHIFRAQNAQCDTLRSG